jgi:hypothetical protein
MTAGAFTVCGYAAGVVVGNLTLQYHDTGTSSKEPAGTPFHTTQSMLAGPLIAFLSCRYMQPCHTTACIASQNAACIGGRKASMASPQPFNKVCLVGHPGRCRWVPEAGFGPTMTEGEFKQLVRGVYGPPSRSSRRRIARAGRRNLEPLSEGRRAASNHALY